MANPPGRECAATDCSNTFTPNKASHRYCSNACSQRGRRHETAQSNEVRICALDGCEAQFTPQRRNQIYCQPAHGRIVQQGRYSGTQEATRELRETRKLLKDAEREKDELAELLALLSTVEMEEVRPPSWASPKASVKGHRATAALLVTDVHYDEVVRPEEVDGLNAYDRRIADLRLRRCFERAIMLSRDYLSGVKYDGGLLALGGDILSGIIHEELRESNAGTIMEAVLHCLEALEAGVDMLVEEWGRLHIVATPGNHGRLTRKPRYKARARDNFDWLLYRLLVRDYRNNERVTFTVPESMDTHFELYSTKFVLTHGDQFRGGSGIAGALSPLSLGAHRKTRREMAAGRSYDVMLMGHFHQRLILPGAGILSGGCLKGFDEFAYGMNLVPEPPSQEFALITPERGITVNAPVFVGDRKKEGW